MKKKIIIGAAVALVLVISAICLLRLPSLRKYETGEAQIDKKIESLKINCSSGSFTVIPTSGTKFVIEELAGTQAAGDSKTESSVKWLTSGKTLYIECGGAGRNYVVGVPEGLALDDLDIMGGNVDAQIRKQTIRDMTVRLDGGYSEIEGCKCIDALIINAPSSSFNIENTFARRMNIKTVSGSVLIQNPEFQRYCKIITDSGDIEMRLRKDAKIDLTESHGTGTITNDFKSDKSGSSYTVKTAKGNINILSYFDADQVVDIGNEAPGEVIIPTAEGESESVTQSESASETAQTSSAEKSVTEAETVKE